MTPSHRDLRLLWSPRSPFVRKVVWVATEIGAMRHITQVPCVVSASRPNLDVMAINPLNKIPVLLFGAEVTEQSICGSHLICNWLDHTFNGGLIPADCHDRMSAQNLEVLGDGMMELSICLLEERQKKPEMRSQKHIDAYWAKLNATMDRLEKLSMPKLRPHIGTFAVACALSYLDFRFAYANWRRTRPMLSQWCNEFCARPAIRDNPFVDDDAIFLHDQV